MTDNEIVKALECCKNRKCITQNCPYSHYPYEGDECHSAMAKDALALINRQKAEIERLQSIRTELSKEIESLNYKERTLIFQLAEEREKAIKEFAERLKYKTYNLDFHSIAIDNLVKEMVGETHNAQD